jgi:RNA polymerase sigma-70 factor (ECF subfamily)
MAEEVGEWRAFYDSSFTEVSAYARRLTGGDRALAEDLTHDAYLAMVAAWRAGRVDRLATGWLIVAVRRRFLNHLRDEEREHRRIERAHSERSGSPSEPDADDDDVATLLAGVGPRGRFALVLRYVDEMSVPEVAEAMGIGVRAAESVLARARRELRANPAVKRTGAEPEEVG